jgi:hypothetical protein
MSNVKQVLHFFAWLCIAKQCNAMQSNTKPSKAKQSKTMQSNAKQTMPNKSNVKCQLYHISKIKNTECQKTSNVK